MTDIVLSAGEPSGDWLGGKLAESLLRLRPDLQIAGLGGNCMRQAGVEMLADCEPLAAMGYWDVAARLPSILRLRRLLLGEIHRRRPKLFVGIDAPDFNLGIAAAAKRAGIATAHYVAPSVWMWRGGRLKNIRRAADKVLCLFPFEPEAMMAGGIAAEFVGHPAAFESIPDKTEARRRLGLGENNPLIALMPGSRTAELNLHLPLFAETMPLLQKRHAEMEFIAAAADHKSAARMRESLPSAKVAVGDAMTALAAADAGLIKSGTSTLQAALAQTPLAVVYRMSSPAFLFARFHRFRLPFFSLPNILCGHFAAPELLQQEATPAMVQKQLSRLLEDTSARRRQLAALQTIRPRLSAPGQDAPAKAALTLL